MESLNYSEVMKYMRNKSGYTQKELAKILGISYKTLSSYEREYTKPPLKLVTEIAKICEFEIIINDINSDEPIKIIHEKK